MDKITYVILLVIINIVGYYCVPVLIDYLHGVGLNSLLIRGVKQNSNSWRVAALIIITIEWFLLMYLFYYLNRRVVQTWLDNNSSRVSLIITAALAILTAIRLVKNFSYLIDKVRL